MKIPGSFPHVIHWREPGISNPMDRVFMGASALYQAGARLRRGLYLQGWLAPRRLPSPVVSIGNIMVGGTGKTPLTAYLARLFQGQGRRVAILSRGYGGQRVGVTCVSDGERLYFRPPEVGEEAFELARSLPGIPVYTGPCRYAAGLAAWQDHRPDVFLLDDGFQHFQLHRDLDIVLLDADQPFGNGRLLPAGPLREPLTALRQADALIMSRYDPKKQGDRLQSLRRLFPRQEIFTAAIEPVSVRRSPGGGEHPLRTLHDLELLAFAGLARPAVFRDSLLSLGVDLRGLAVFPDHHAFTPGELSSLLQEARRTGAQALITTAKDWARLGETWQGERPLWVLEVAARVEPEAGFKKYLAAALECTWSGSGLQSAYPEGGAPRAPRALPPQVRRRFGSLITNGKSILPHQDVRRILVRVPNWVGDAVMSLPVLVGLRQRFPQAQISILASPRVAPLFLEMPGVAEVVSYPAGRGKWPGLWGLKGKFDLALALPNSFESALGLWLTRTPHRVGFAVNCRAPFLTAAVRGKTCLTGLHQVFYYLGLLEALGPVTTYFPPELTVSETELTEGRHLLTSVGLNPGRPWMGLVPGAAYGPAKRWPAERYAAVGEFLKGKFQADVVILGGPGDQEAAAAVQHNSHDRFFNLAGKTTLRQALAVLGNLRLLITNDSGLMHAASAIRVPVVAIFGSTDPAATGPFTGRATVIHHPLPCSPCLERTCTKNYACLTDITVEEVAVAAQRWLKEI